MWMPGWEAHTASRGLDGVILRGGIMTIDFVDTLQRLN
jgi:hypothetical protein